MSMDEGFSDPSRFIFTKDIAVYDVVNKLHWNNGGSCAHCSALAERSIEYPCPTIKSMDRVDT